MSLNGQPCDNPVTTTRQESDNGVTFPVEPAQIRLMPVLATLATLATPGTLAYDSGTTQYFPWLNTPYSDQAPSIPEPAFPSPNTPHSPPPLAIDLDALYADRERARLRAEANAVILETARFDAQADAAHREAHDTQLRNHVCQLCKTLFNGTNEDGTVKVMVGERRKHCGRNDGGTIIGREDCVRKQDALRQRNYRARKNA